MSARLALHGGEPVRTRALPHVLDPSGRTLGAEELRGLERVLSSGVLNGVLGAETPLLEREMADLHGVEEAVACSSGTAALHLAVAAAAPDPGDEVITTPISDFGSVAPILAQNAVPVFADVDPLTGNLDPRSVAAAVTERTRAVLVVHLFGGGAPARELRELADARGLTLIEDCAQAWLCRTPDGDLAGTIGHVGCFSLQQYKHITAGDGGLAITRDRALAATMRAFADKGRDREGQRRLHGAYGLNYRMTELQAAVARAQLAKLPDVVAARRRSADLLLSRLSDLPGVRTPAPDGHAWWLMPLVLADIGDNRAWAQALSAEGVPAAAGYLERPLYLEPALAERPVYGRSRYPLDSEAEGRAVAYAPGSCPAAEELIERTLVTLQWNEGYTEEDVDDIATAIRKIHDGLRGGGA